MAKKYYIFLIIILVAVIVFTLYKSYEGFQLAECATLKDCKGCANTFGCSWCVKQNKCVEETKTNSMCPNESTVTNPIACNVEAEGGTLLSAKTYGQCSSSTSCGSCLSTPDCFWCSNKNACVSNIDVYKTCADDTILNSFSQCELSSTITPTTTTTSSVYSGDSIIPIVGLSRSTDGSLTQSSINTIIESLSARGYPITNVTNKAAALELIKKEQDFYTAQYKTKMGTYLGEVVVDFTDDTKLLASAKDMQRHIQDLKDVSRSVNLLVTSMFTEGFQQDLDTLKTISDDENIKNKLIGYKIQIFLLANLVAIGSIFFI